MIKTFCFLLLCLLSIVPQTFSKVEMVVEVFRHGAREPIGAPYDAADWTEYEGELTSAGLRQHYLLGKEMRKKYIERLGFLSPQFNHTELYVRSTDVNRTIMSVSSHLLGLYPLGAGARFPDDYPLKLAVPPYKADYDIQDLGFNVLPEKYQPIPVHIVEKSKDALLTPDDVCPSHEEMKKAQKSSDLYQTFQEKFKPVFDEVQQVFNLSNALKTSSLATITSDMFCTIMQNNPVPKNLTKKLLDDMTFLKGLEVQFVDVGTNEERKLLSTPFLKTIQQYFQAKIQHNYPLKYSIFSAHDTTLQPYMASLNLTNWECLLDQYEAKNDSKKGNCIAGYPIFASQLIVELHSNQTKIGKEYFVKVIYNGVEMKLCETEETECLFDEFNQRLNNYVLSDEDFETSCGAETKKVNNAMSSFLKKY